MDGKKARFEDLIQNPTENLSTEMKRWFDPDKYEGIAKIVKGCIALRNNDGGVFIVGFKDDGQPDTENLPDDVYGEFHPDKIQGLISKYASEPFEVEVHFIARDDVDYPIFSVPSGVETPVALKRGLHGGDGKKFFEAHQVYVRSLNSNNIVSTTQACYGDWKGLVKKCFDNREADIARFVKRHLSNLPPSIIEAFSGQKINHTPAKTKTDLLNQFIIDTYERYWGHSLGQA